MLECRPKPWQELLSLAVCRCRRAFWAHSNVTVGKSDLQLDERVVSDKWRDTVEERKRVRKASLMEAALAAIRNEVTH